MKIEQSMSYESDLSAYELLSECRDPLMQKVVGLVDKCRNARSTFITGENGTGKELVANALKERGDRRQRQLVTVDCANLNPNIMGSELFGHEKGAFTGASERKIGLFEAAEDGTAFLDEIGEIPFDVQHRLLRVLQGQPFNRVGGTTPIQPSFRLITATNRDLPKLVAEGKFRKDLFYRINVFTINIPPLRQRGSDVARLANHFVDQFSGRTKTLASDAEAVLCKHSWPGNVRELKNVIERAVTFADGEEVVTLEHLDLMEVEESFPEVPAAPVAPEADQSAVQKSFSLEEEVDRLVDHIYKLNGANPAENLDLLSRLEVPIIRSVLRRNKGNKIAASHDLGIGRQTLYNKIQTYKIED